MCMAHFGPLHRGKVYLILLGCVDQPLVELSTFATATIAVVAQLLAFQSGNTDRVIEPTNFMRQSNID
jgi:hypothetical protein